MKDIVFERLEKSRHDRNSFDCGVDVLNVFIKEVANQQQGRGLRSHAKITFTTSVA